MATKFKQIKIKTKLNLRTFMFSNVKCWTESWIVCKIDRRNTIEMPLIQELLEQILYVHIKQHWLEQHLSLTIVHVENDALIFIIRNINQGDVGRRNLRDLGY